MNIGADGKLYYATVPNWSNSTGPTSGEIGSMDLTTHLQSYQVLPYGPGFIRKTADGSVWVTEFNNAGGQPTVDRYAGLGGPDTQIFVPKGPNWYSETGNGIDGGMAVGRDGRIWYGSNNDGTIGVINPATDAVTSYALQSPAEHYQPVPQFMRFASDGNLWVTDAFNGAVFRVTPTGADAGSDTLVQLPEGPYSTSEPVFVQGITEGPDKKLYVGDPTESTSGFLDSGAPSSQSFSELPLPSLGIRPYVLAGAPGKVYFTEIRFQGLGIYDIKTRKTAVLPLYPFGYGGVVVDSSGTPWVGCYTMAGVGCVEEVALTSRWQVYPSQSVTLYTSDSFGNSMPPGLIGIGETGDSGPFIVTTLGTSVCNASRIAGFDHDIEVTPVSVGTCTVLIQDRNGRTVSVAVTVQNGTGTEAGVGSLMQAKFAQRRPTALP